VCSSDLICYNPQEAERDLKTRESIVAHVEEVLRNPPGPGTKEAAALYSHPAYGRYLRRLQDGALRLDRGQIREDERYVFMDLTNYEQVYVDEAQTGGKGGFLKDGEEVKVLVYNGRPLDMELPAAVTLKIVSADPGVRGDTVSGASKPARMETGITVNVPLFVNEGDTIKVDTRTGQYLGRA